MGKEDKLTRAWHIVTIFWFIHGNHDSDSDDYYCFIFESGLAHRNLHGRVEVIAGIRVAGLGRVFRGKVWHPDLFEGKPVWQDPIQYLQAQSPAIQRVAKQYAGLTRQHHSSIWFNDYERLFDQEADILVTHEAPSCHRYGFSTLDELTVAMEVKQILHGHHHENYCDQINIGDSSISVQGVGLANCKDENGNYLNL